MMTIEVVANCKTH